MFWLIAIILFILGIIAEGGSMNLLFLVGVSLLGALGAQILWKKYSANLTLSKSTSNKYLA